MQAFAQTTCGDRPIHLCAAAVGRHRASGELQLVGVYPVLVIRERLSPKRKTGCNK